jgi:hypothetical protein
MPWTAPPQLSSPEPNDDGADERSLLIAELDHQRATLLFKCAGLTGERLARQPVEPSTLSLLGLIRHLSDVERTWFRIRFAGQELPDLYFTEDDPDRDFNDLDPEHAEADFARYQAELGPVRAAIEGRGLEETFISATRGVLSLRWLLLHMISEYARHNGHADLLRERIDGATGE